MNLHAAPVPEKDQASPIGRPRAGRRYELLDTLRGAAVVAMVIYHTLYDIDVFGGNLGELFASTGMKLFHAYIIGSFFLLCGIGCTLSHHNIRRGVKIVLIAYAITLVTWFLGEAFTIWFGVLHCLGFSCILYGLSARLWEKLPISVSALIFAALFLLCFFTLPQLTTLPYLYAFGFVERTFSSADYFPLLPWTFLVFFGACLGRWLKRANPAPPIFSWHVSFLSLIGRRALLIYVLHQPVVFALVWAIMTRFGRA